LIPEPLRGIFEGDCRFVFVGVLSGMSGMKEEGEERRGDRDSSSVRARFERGFEREGNRSEGKGKVWVSGRNGDSCRIAGL